jgi:hypothetical protein
MNTSMFETQHFFQHDQAWNDSQWFAARPFRKYRLRAVHPSELHLFRGATHALVRQVERGTRHRRGITLLELPAELDDKLRSEDFVAFDVDAVLAEIWRASLSSKQTTLDRCIAKGLKKFRSF